MRELQIRTAMIQLKGLIRRRGLTRNEKKELKMIQIEQLKLRIENMQSTKQETVEQYDLYNEKKRMIDEFLAKKAEESYQLKYTYDQQIADMDLLITSEKEALAERKIWWEDTNTAITESAQTLTDSLKEIIGDPLLLGLFTNFGIEIQDILDKANALSGTATEFRSLKVAKTLAGTEGISFLPGRARGMQYVSETMPAMIHEGEHIVPAGQDVGGGISIGNVTIQVKEIAEINSVEKLAALLAQAESNGLMRKGRTNFKLRFG